MSICREWSQRIRYRRQPRPETEEGELVLHGAGRGETYFLLLVALLGQVLAAAGHLGAAHGVLLVGQVFLLLRLVAEGHEPDAGSSWAVNASAAAAAIEILEQAALAPGQLGQVRGGGARAVEHFVVRIPVRVVVGLVVVAAVQLAGGLSVAFLAEFQLRQFFFVFVFFVGILHLFGLDALEWPVGRGGDGHVRPAASAGLGSDDRRRRVCGGELVFVLVALVVFIPVDFQLVLFLVLFFDVLIFLLLAQAFLVGVGLGVAVVVAHVVIFVALGFNDGARVSGGADAAGARDRVGRGGAGAGAGFVDGGIGRDARGGLAELAGGGLDGELQRCTGVWRRRGSGADEGGGGGGYGCGAGLTYTACEVSPGVRRCGGGRRAR